ncbi:hypothetical protein Leryth_023663 [Lithospermum erythrorhizon]|uniref:Uncharacterized protein n=1 Tax=Lithospermum erythrorhizon TaxID=34254 RepID=A0AAV3RYT7_LITER|nr:hypothetical protein Leryth_023663 [Lithospermum erythrorhizon]
MGHLRSLEMLLLVLWLVSLPQLIKAQLPADPMSGARALDSLLQDYAYQALISPKTGVVYDGTVPSNLTGVKVSALRLRSGSLRIRGVESFKEFQIPVGVFEEPYVERLVLVYHNLGNSSSHYYPLPGYTHLASVLGLLAYDAGNLSATNLPELDIRASAQPISIKFSNVDNVPNGLVPRCVWFDIQGAANFSNLLPGNMCSTFQQGHFSIVVESAGLSSPPKVSPGLAPLPTGKKSKKGFKIWVFVGSVLGGLALMAILGFVVIWIGKYKRRKKMQQMEYAADVGETLHMTTLGSAKAPAAAVTRTQPSLESEYVT